MAVGGVPRFGLGADPEPQAAGRGLSGWRLSRQVAVPSSVTFLGHLIGSVEAGKQADLVVCDPNRLEITPAHDLGPKLPRAASPRSVRDVLAPAETLVQEGRLVRVGDAAPIE